MAGKRARPKDQTTGGPFGLRLSEPETGLALGRALSRRARQAPLQKNGGSPLMLPSLRA